MYSSSPSSALHELVGGAGAGARRVGVVPAQELAVLASRRRVDGVQVTIEEAFRN